MTMPKKGSRGINVDGAAYRFMVSDEEGGKMLRVTIESGAHPGHVLVATFGRHLLDPIGNPQVEHIIRYARHVGWAPAVMNNFALGNQDIAEMLDAEARR